MADASHVLKLREGVEAWNAWRTENPSVAGDFSEANLSGADLRKADLRKADLSGVDLSSANLRGADLIEAGLTEADLSGVDLSGAKLYGANLSRANLSGANLRGANLYKADLTQADLIMANLSGANLSEANFKEAALKEANFSGANLRMASLQGADLLGANLRGADLRDVKVESPKGLVSQQFGDTNLAGTVLPEHLKEFKALGVVEELSKNARKVFISLLLGCLYSWMTIATTSDARLLPNSASSPLPIIGTEIPIAYFYFAAPLLLVLIYVYFHLYLNRLWKAFAGLPAVFPDGKQLDESAYPWLLNSLVRRHFSRLRKSRSILARAEEWISIILAWWLVPFTLAGFWLRYIPRHDWYGTGFQILLLAFCSGWGVVLYCSASRTLRGQDDPRHLKLSKRELFQKYRNNWKLFFQYGNVYWVLTLLLLVVVGGISTGAINGEPADPAPRFLAGLAWGAFADLSGSDVSTRPDNYWLITQEEDRRSAIIGAKLAGLDLRYASADRAFLAEGNLAEADLSGANLIGADLTFTNLIRANLGGAKLTEASVMQFQIELASGDCETVLPEGLRRPAKWCPEVTSQ